MPPSKDTLVAVHDGMLGLCAQLLPNSSSLWVSDSVTDNELHKQRTRRLLCTIVLPARVTQHRVERLLRGAAGSIPNSALQGDTRRPRAAIVSGQTANPKGSATHKQLYRTVLRQQLQ